MTTQPPPPSELRAVPGQHVSLELRDAGEIERLEFDLVGENEADYYQGFLGENTPLGKAIFGQKSGSRVTYLAGGAPIEVRLLEVRPSTRQPNPQRGEERQAAIDQAVAASHLKDRLSAASSMSNKWGDLDPDAAPK